MSKPKVVKDPVAAALDRLVAGIHREISKAESAVAAAQGVVETAASLARSADGLTLHVSFAPPPPSSGGDGWWNEPVVADEPIVEPAVEGELVVAEPIVEPAVEAAVAVEPPPDTAAAAASGNEPVEPIEPAPIVRPGDLDLPPIPPRGKRQRASEWRAEVARSFAAVALADVALAPEADDYWEETYAGPATPAEILDQVWWAWLYACYGADPAAWEAIGGPQVAAQYLGEGEAWACRLSPTGRRLLGLAEGDPRATDATRGRLGAWIAPTWWQLGEAPADRDAYAWRYPRQAPAAAAAAAENVVEAEPEAVVEDELEAVVEDEPEAEAPVVQVARLRPVAVPDEPAPLRPVEEPVASTPAAVALAAGEKNLDVPPAIAEAVAAARPDVALTVRPGVDPGSIEITARRGAEVRSVTIFRGGGDAAAARIAAMIGAFPPPPPPAV